MKVSKLIKKLKKLQKIHGDLPVEYADRMPPDSQFQNCKIDNVNAYDAEGWNNKDQPPAFILIM